MLFLWAGSTSMKIHRFKKFAFFLEKIRLTFISLIISSFSTPSSDINGQEFILSASTQSTHLNCTLLSEDGFPLLKVGCGRGSKKGPQDPAGLSGMLAVTGITGGATGSKGALTRASGLNGPTGMGIRMKQWFMKSQLTAPMDSKVIPANVIFP